MMNNIRFRDRLELESATDELEAEIDSAAKIISKISSICELLDDIDSEIRTVVIRKEEAGIQDTQFELELMHKVSTSTDVMKWIKMSAMSRVSDAVDNLNRTTRDAKSC